MACRPTLLYVAAYVASLTPHEAAHALTACYLGFSSTLYQLWVNPDISNATPTQVAIIAAAGPAFNLVLGLAALLIYIKYRDRRSSFVVLMFAINNLYVVFGNLTSAALGGDINRVLRILGTGVPFLYATSLAGTICLAGFMFAMGRELVSWAPAGVERKTAVVVETLAPWLIGSVTSFIAYLPLPSFLIWPTIVGSAFWAFAVLGAWSSRTPSSREDHGAITVPDVIVTALALLLVRLLVPGFHLSR